MSFIMFFDEENVELTLSGDHQRTNSQTRTDTLKKRRGMKVGSNVSRVFFLIYITGHERIRNRL